MSRRNRRPRVMDAGGAQRRDQLVEEQRRQDIERATERALLEESKVSKAVPILGSVAEIVEVVTNQKRLPFYGVDADIPIRSVGRVLFGPDGYNIVAFRRQEPDVGPHFDDYRGGFAPWSIHADSRGYGQVRGMILPDDDWAEYKLRYPLETELGTDAQSFRRELGKRVLNNAGTIYTASLNPDTHLIFWQGDVDIPPGVHDLERHTISSAATFSVRNRNQVAEYVVYAKSLSDEIPSGFIEV